MVLKTKKDYARKCEITKFIGKCALIECGGKRIVAIGDLHLGFEESLNRSGVLVTRIMRNEMLKEFEKVFDILGDVDYIVLLGDIKHYFGKILRQEWDDVLKVIGYLSAKCKKVIIVRGNHDVLLDVIVKKLGKKRVGIYDYWRFNDICFCHGDEDYAGLWEKDIKAIIAGHGHPAVVLEEGFRREKYKCFLSGKFQGKKIIILPSFAEWYIGSDVLSNEVVLAWDIDFSKFRVYAVDENKALDFGKVKDLINAQRKE